MNARSRTKRARSSVVAHVIPEASLRARPRVERLRWPLKDLAQEGKDGVSRLDARVFGEPIENSSRPLFTNGRHHGVDRYPRRDLTRGVPPHAVGGGEQGKPGTSDNASSSVLAHLAQVAHPGHVDAQNRNEG